jgi:hypothetical protein
MGLWSSGYDSALTFRKEKSGINPRFESGWAHSYSSYSYQNNKPYKTIKFPLR